MNLKDRITEHRQALEHKHGWDVGLECPGCGYSGLPAYTGWKPRYSMAFGTTPTIYACLECPSCGRDLEPEAASKLVELFKEIRIPGTNRRILAGFFLAFAILVLTAVLLFVFTKTIFGLIPLLFMTLLLCLIPVMNRRIAAIRTGCSCGDPDYIFMGMLGRAYCFRCSNCGRLLKLRD